MSFWMPGSKKKASAQTRPLSTCFLVSINFVAEYDKELQSS